MATTIRGPNHFRGGSIRRLTDIFRFKASPRAPFGLSASTYYSVLSSRPTWPTLFALVNPKGDAYAVPGYGVPKASDARKEDLRQPMERGAYWITSPDRTTVLTLRLMSKEEAGFEPGELLNTEFSQRFSSDVRSAIQATWAIGQITFDSHDPLVLPAVDFAVRIAAQLAELTDGVIADPARFSYLRASDLSRDQEFHVENHVAVYADPTDDDSRRLFTLGLSKFGLPEMEITRVPVEQAVIAESLLYSMAFTILKNGPVAPGDTVASPKAPLQIALAISATQPTGAAPAYELIPARQHSVSECLTAWQREN